LIMELFSKEVLVNIQFPHGIQCLEHYDGRIYAGSTQGTIYSVDLDAYAMHQTEKLGAIFVSKRRRQEQLDAGSSKNWTMEEKVFGKKKTENNNNAHDDDNNYGAGYQTDWVGHNHPVTSIAFLTEDEPRRMISGDNFGQIRIWEMESRTCLNVIQPWSFTNSADDKSATPKHPVTSIRIIPQPDTLASSGIFEFSSRNSKKLSNFSTLVTPLQKYLCDPNETANNVMPTSSIAAGKIRVPFLNCNRTTQNLEYWEARPILRKRQQQSASVKEVPETTKDRSEDKEQIASMSEQIKILKNELQAKDSEVKRWQTVNNTLMSRLNTKY
jgi:WD40 repeat protein